jgi:hypothetical protein
VSGLPGALCAWCLSKNGAKLIGKEEPARYSNKNTTEHEVKLSDLRMALESVGLGDNWTSEMELRRIHNGKTTGLYRDAQVIPDGIFIADCGGPAVIAVELELNPKNHARYKKIFSDYAGKSSIGFVWYIVGASSIAKTIVGEWQKTPRMSTSPKLLVTKLNELVANPYDANVFLFGGKWQTMTERFGLKKPLLPAQNEVRVVAHGVSKEAGTNLSGEAAFDPERNRGVKSAPGISQGVPSAVDPSPTTM